MIKIVLDSDGLIKLTKSGCLQKLLDNFTFLITEEVYYETVIKGMERLYDDAYGIEEQVKKGKLKVENTKNSKKASNILKDSELGRGETSSLHLYFNMKAEAIISDDRTFLNILQHNNIPFVTTADVMVRLHQLKIISKDEILNALEIIRPYISRSSYLKRRFCSLYS